MKPELKARILAFNKEVAANKEKASDLDILLTAIFKLAPGQVKKFLSDEDVLAVLAKHGYSV